MKIKYFDRAIEFLFMAAMFLTPVIFDRRIGIVFSGTKSATLRLIVLLILSIWLIKLLVGGKTIFKRSILDWPILSYILAITIATITSVNFMISFFGFYGRYEGLITWYCYAILFFIAINYLQGFTKMKQFIALIIPTATTMAVYGIIQRHGIDPYVWGGVVTWQRVIGTIGQPNFFSAYMIMAFFALAYFLFIPEQEKTQVKIEPLKKISKFNKKQKSGLEIDWVKLSENLLPVLYYFATPFLFVLMIYSQSGQNVFIWYLFFFAMTITTLMFVYYYHQMPPVYLKILAGISMILIYVGNFYTQSRGGFLGFAVGFVLLILLVPRKSLLKNWKALSLLMLAILIASAVTVIDPNNSPFERFAGEIGAGKGVNMENKPETTVELGGAAGSRGETWKSGLGIVSDNPLFGIGPEVLKMVFPRYETDLFRFKEAFHVKQDRNHNESLDVPVTKGLISFFLYFSIVFIIFKFGIKKIFRSDLSDDKKIFLAANLAAIAAYIIQNQFSFGVIAITSLYWVLWAMVVNIDSEEQKEDDKEFKFDDIPWLFAGIIAIVFLSLCYVSIMQFEADKYFKTGKTYMDMRQLDQAIPQFETSIKYFPFEGGTITHLGISLLNSAMAAPPAQQAEIQQKALNAFEYGMKVDPYNADNFYIVSRIYLMRGNIPVALEYTRKALKIDPYYAEAYLTLASIAEQTGNYQEAQKYYSEAYRINPTLAESKIKVVLGMIQNGQYEQAFILLQEMLVSDSRNVDVHNALGMVYTKRGDLARAKEEFETSLSIDPNNGYAKMMMRK